MAVRVADATDGRMPDTQRCFFIVLFTDEKYDKVTFLLIALFTDEKRGKSHIRERSPLLYISSRVHELVARAVRGECVRH